MFNILEKLGLKSKEKGEEEGRREEKAEDHSSFFFGPRPLTEEEEEELINNLVNIITKYGMETPAIFFLESYKPVAVIGSYTVLLPSAPFLEIFGIRGYEYTSLFMKRKNVDRLIEKLEEAQEKRLKEEKKKKEGK